MTALKKKVELPMVNGSSSTASYAVVARKGKVLLAIKPNAIMPGAAWGAPGTTYIGMRLRSAPKPSYLNLKDEAPDSNVASFSDHQELGLDTAWPDVVFEKHQPGDRASTQIGVFLRGDAKDNPKLLLDELENKKFATKAADYIIQLAGADNIIVERRDLINWFQDHYAPLFGKLAKSFEAHKKVGVAIEENVGVFGMQAVLMKKLSEANEQETAPDIDNEEHEDNEEGKDD